jgi:hypothetical protein
MDILVVPLSLFPSLPLNMALRALIKTFLCGSPRCTRTSTQKRVLRYVHGAIKVKENILAVQIRG